jgi:hypothetical protein
MANTRSSGMPRGLVPIEHELTEHLERAHELAERAQQSNDAAQHEIDRALEIAEDIRGQARDQGRR